VAGVCRTSGRGLLPPTCKLSHNALLTLQRDCLNQDFQQDFYDFQDEKNPAYLINLVKILVQTVNEAYAQSRLSGILFALANGKLYFEFLKIFSVPENTCSCRGLKMLPKSAFSLNV